MGRDGLTTANVLTEALHSSFESSTARMQHVSNMIVQLLFFGQTPTFEAETMRKNSVVILGVAQVRSNGKGTVETWTLLNIVGIRLNPILRHDGSRLDRSRSDWPREKGWLSGQIVGRTTVQERAQIGNEQGVLDVSKGCERGYLGICKSRELVLSTTWSEGLRDNGPTTSRMSTKSASYSFPQVPRRGLRWGLSSRSSSPSCCWRRKGCSAATLALFQRPGRADSTRFAAFPAAANCSISTSGGKVVDGRPASSSRRGIWVEVGRVVPLGTLRLLALLLLVAAAHGGR
jgi:hypothetical protein